MVHLVTERPREAVVPVLWRHWRRLFRSYDPVRERDSARKASGQTTFTVPVIYELVYISTSVTFLVGSVLFLPSFGIVGADLGCDLFIWGSVVLASLTAFDLFGDVLRECGVGSSEQSPAASGAESPATNRSSPVSRRTTVRQSVVSRVSSREEQVQAHSEYDIVDFDNATVEKILYLIGSVIFAVGTFYWQHPRTTGKYISAEKEQVLYWAIAMFIVGSVVFVLAAFLNALSLATTHLTFTKWAVVTCSVYELGGILYVIGSVCFMPNQHCGELMEVLGAWNFILGSLCYVIGGMVEFMKMVALLFLKRQEEMAAEIISRAWRRRSEHRARLASAMSPSSQGSPLQTTRSDQLPLLSETSARSEQLPSVEERGGMEQREEDDGEGETFNIFEADSTPEAAAQEAEAPPEAPSALVASQPASRCTTKRASSMGGLELETELPHEAPPAVASSRAGSRCASKPASPARGLAPEPEPGPEAPSPAEGPVVFSCAPGPRSEQSTAEPDGHAPLPGEASLSSSPSDTVVAPCSVMADQCDCGAHFMEDACFCQRCGARRKDLSTHLAAVCSCGTAFTPDASFCRMCGVKRAEVRQVDARESVSSQASARGSRRGSTEQGTTRRRVANRSGAPESSEETCGERPQIRRAATELAVPRADVGKSGRHPQKNVASCHSNNGAEADAARPQHAAEPSRLRPPAPNLPIGRPRLDSDGSSGKQQGPGLVATFVRAMSKLEDADGSEQRGRGSHPVPQRANRVEVVGTSSPPETRRRSLERSRGPAGWRRSSTHSTLDQADRSVVVEMSSDPMARGRRSGEREASATQSSAVAPAALARRQREGAPAQGAAAAQSGSASAAERARSTGADGARRVHALVAAPSTAGHASGPGLFSTFIEAVRAPHEHDLTEP